MLLNWWDSHSVGFDACLNRSMTDLELITSIILHPATGISLKNFQYTQAYCVSSQLQYWVEKR